MKCLSCSTTKENKNGQWWHLKGYFGFTGTFCPDCYDKISHDSYGQPNHPKDYMLMVLKLHGEKVVYSN